MYYFAHAGEIHETAAESASHWVVSWYVALPLFLLAVAIFAAMVQLIFKKTQWTLISVAFAALFAGFASYNLSAIVSAVAITGGLVLSGYLALGGLLNSNAKEDS